MGRFKLLFRQCCYMLWLLSHPVSFGEVRNRCSRGALVRTCRQDPHPNLRWGLLATGQVQSCWESQMLPLPGLTVFRADRVHTWQWICVCLTLEQGLQDHARKGEAEQLQALTRVNTSPNLCRSGAHSGSSPSSGQPA